MRTVSVGLNFVVAASLVLVGSPANAAPQVERTIDNVRPTGTTSDGSKWDTIGVEGEQCETTHPEVGLKKALEHHALFQNGFKLKLQSGTYQYVPGFKSSFADDSPRQLRDAIFRRLAGLDRLGMRTAVLIYDIDEDGVCVWLLDARRILSAKTARGISPPAFRVRQGLQIEGRAAGRFMRTIVPIAVSVAPRLVDLTALSEARDLLLPPPIANALTQSQLDRLLILPVADFAMVPFGALPIAGGVLGDRFALVILPEVTTLFPERAGIKSDEHDFTWGRGVGALIVGVGSIKGTPHVRYPNLICADHTPDVCMSQLPGAHDEADFVARTMKSPRLLNESARKDEILTLLKPRGFAYLLWFSTHGIADPKDPMDKSFLALYDGFLTAKEIKSLHLPMHPLVVMSACQTGMGKVFEGGVFGLARAWYYVGAGQVVVSLWSVNDYATKTVMVLFAEKLRDTGVPESALRDAIKEGRRKIDPAGRDPGLWAGFTVVGNPTGQASRYRRP